jgi:hypothetical protein
MRILGFTLAAALAMGGAAFAQPASSTQTPAPPRDAATLCLDGLGSTHPSVCTKMSATRKPTPPDICICTGPYRTVKAPWCAPGEKPPVDDAAFEHARAKAAEDGSLFGDRYQGRRFCVPLQ